MADLPGVLEQAFAWRWSRGRPDRGPQRPAFRGAFKPFAPSRYL